MVERSWVWFLPPGLKTHLQPSDDSDGHAEVEGDHVLLEVGRQLLGQDRPHGGQDQGGDAEDVADQLALQLKEMGL